MKKRIYIICGPTASGKTGLAIKVAKKIGGEIINADAIQVYKDVPLLTAVPGQKERQMVSHHLFSYLDAFTENNVNAWLKDVQQVESGIESPIFVGGSGMYIKALIEGLSPIPDIPDDIRNKVRQMTPEQIKSELKSVTPFSDPQRLMRALEVEYTTGKSILWWQKQPRVPVLKNAEFKVICILPKREKLYQQCDERFLRMVNSGALAEVVDLLGKNPKKTGGVFHALGVLPLIDFLNGKISLEQAVAQAQLDTRHYAKRQMTWFRHQITPDLLLEEPVVPELS